MEFVVIVPARFGATRLPGKPLLDLGGRSMIEQVWRQARRSRASRVIVATDDERIRQVLAPLGAEVCMTRADHPSGTDRLQEVAVQLNLAADSVVVNVQGDEPLMPPEVIDQLASNLLHSGMPMATLAAPLTHREQLFDPNVVKVVTGAAGRALYFSRAPVPWQRDDFDPADQVGRLPPGGPWLRHVGVYAYRVSLLNDFVRWPRGNLEHTEKLEQLRVLEQGANIHVAPACVPIPPGVDTPADLARVRALLAADEEKKETW